jgi:hypothetical protein
MSAFEDFVQQELPKRGYLNTDVSQETIIIRRGTGPRQFEAVTLSEGQVLAKVNGVLVGVNLNDSGLSGRLRKAVLTVTTPSATWDIPHNLNSENVIVQAFDENKFVIIPNSIQIVDANTVELTFNTVQSGTARVIFLD